MLQDGTRDEYIDEETLDAASAAALGIVATDVRAGEVDDDEEPRRGDGIVVHSYDAGDEVCFDVEGPVALRSLARPAETPEIRSPSATSFYSGVSRSCTAKWSANGAAGAPRCTTVPGWNVCFDRAGWGFAGSRSRTSHRLASSGHSSEQM